MFINFKTLFMSVFESESEPDSDSKLYQKPDPEP